MRCPLNLKSHNHNQHAGRPCFYLAVLIGLTLVSFSLSPFFPAATHIHSVVRRNTPFHTGQEF